MSNSVQPHRRQPTRQDSPGKNTGVGCHFLLQCRKVKSESEVAQSYPTFSDPMDCSLSGSSIHGIFQARVLEWGAIAFSDCHCLDNVKATRLKASLPIIELIQTTLPSGDAGWVWNSVAQQDCWHWWWNLVWYLPIHLLHNHELPCYRQLKRVSLFDGVII